MTSDSGIARAPAKTIDVFAVARYFDDLWNSTARAVSADCIEWQCNTWGSGNGCGGWENFAHFELLVEALKLDSWCKRRRARRASRGDPAGPVRRGQGVLERVDENPEEWPWLREEGEDDRFTVAAEMLGRTTAEVAVDRDLCFALGMKV